MSFAVCSISSSTIAFVVGEALMILNGPVLLDTNLLYDSVAKIGFADVVIDG